MFEDDSIHLRPSELSDVCPLLESPRRVFKYYGLNQKAPSACGYLFAAY